MIKKLILLLFIFLTCSCKDKRTAKEQRIFDRIEFVFNLKQTIGGSVWKTFNEKKFDVPLVYFTDTSSYIANPTRKFLSTFKSRLVFESTQIKIYKTAKRVDSLPFHMETGMILVGSTNAYNYHSPFMMCSSYEETAKTVPGISSIEDWAVLVMHEYFHGFQYKHPRYLKYLERIKPISRDSLQSFYKNNNWYKNSIDKENEFLLKAISEQDSTKRKSLIDSFFVLRNERRKIAKQKLNIDIEKYEKCNETMEGTARYIEYSLYKIFSTNPPDYKYKLIKSDTAFKSFKEFRNFSIENHKYRYLTSVSGQYFYAIGFDMARLLDKLHIDYKTRLFNEGGLSLEQLLLKRNGR